MTDNFPSVCCYYLVLPQQDGSFANLVPGACVFGSEELQARPQSMQQGLNDFPVSSRALWGSPRDERGIDR